MRTALLAAALLSGMAHAGPLEAIAAARKDAETLDEDVACHVLYLTDYAIPENKRAEFEIFQRVQINQRSREAEFAIPVVVAREVYRIDVRDYGWTRELLDKLIDAPEPYFHADKEKIVFRTVRGKRVKRVVRKRGLSDHFANDDMLALIARTGSQVPIVRAEWFFVQTAIQEQRVLGYYDLLGIKNRADYEKLIGLRRPSVKEGIRDKFAIIRKSGISQHNRQVKRCASEGGGAWKTLDVFDTETGKRNAVSKFGGDFDYQAEEHIGPLPNGLYGMLLCNRDGTLQNTAPDKIGADDTATSRDNRIHVGMCFRCHKEGLRPLDDYARKTYQGPLAFGAVDFATFKKLQREYLGELQHFLLTDRLEYDYNLRKLSGWTTAEYATALKEWWKWAHDDEVTLERAALELGCEPGAFRAALIRHGLPPPIGVGRVDDVFGPFIHEPPGTVRREHFDEHFQRALNVLKGAVAP